MENLMRRRSLICLLRASMLLPLRTLARVIGNSARTTLLTAPLEIGGNWGGSAQRDVTVVIERMRVACLNGVALVSDRQPDRLHVDDRPNGGPSVWLQTAAPTTAWINLVVGPRDWCKLAYQFGHELGHVLCNSWQSDAKPRNPCQWIEESLVEAFSLRGLAILSENWALAPPFPNDGGFAGAIRDYTEEVKARYRAAAYDQGAGAGLGAWFGTHEKSLSVDGGLDAARGAVATMFDLVQANPAMLEDLGALNRWPGRSGVALSDYLAKWETSCTELGTPGKLPKGVRDLLATP
jgi:hypothetical protein